ncbi:hypothetical protein ACFO0N_07885 [Halobium salinum]|uniref:Phasin protein n=1 Tax=Halobium salinum TaxID=1364940 RepID=A0ABD5PAZ7_9EURY|nr:hypothetical protein [Halobium salinum]
MSDHDTPSTTDPFTSFFDAQRRAVEQSQRLFHQSVEFQRRSMRTMADGMEASQSLQKKSTDVTRTAVEAYLDAMEASVPMGAPMFESMHAVVRGQFEASNDISDQTWDAMRAGMEDGVETYDDLLEDYLAAVDDSVEAFVGTLDEFDASREGHGHAPADD